MIKKIFLMLFLCGIAFNHTLWINSTVYYGRVNEATVVFLGWGHRFPVADFVEPEQITDYGVLLPWGDEKLNPEGGFLEAPIKFKRQGYYIVHAQTKSGFYTMVLREGRIYHYTEPMDRIKGRVLVSNYYQQFAKAILVAGKPSRGFDRAVGLKMEIIPLTDPSDLKVGDFMKIKVLFEGRPLPFIPVYATYEGFSTKDDYAFATETDTKGIAEVRILHWGMWMIKAHLKKPPEGDLVGKCKVISLVSTLTFEVK